MSKRQIITLPNQILKQTCKPITFPLTQESYQNIQNLKITFRQSFMSSGVKTLGLAAPQIGVLQRFFIIPRSINFAGVSIQVLKSVVRNFTVYINPRIIQQSENKCVIVQNCLSIGNKIYRVQRSQNVKVEYFNLQGERIQEKLSGIRARVFLHENDHLDGITLDDKEQIQVRVQRKILDPHEISKQTKSPLQFKDLAVNFAQHYFQTSNDPQLNDFIPTLKHLVARPHEMYLLCQTGDIALIQQVYFMLRQSSQSSCNVNNIATCIRQVVLRNDCLDQKNDVLDFFFLCEKNAGQVKKSKNGENCWTKTVEKKLNQLRGLHELYQKSRKIQFKRGFSILQVKQLLHQVIQSQPDIDPSTIQVQQDIRVKTLYFFKWCKFIQYGKSIKKLRLKEIDDLRKSLTFNQYAVKFSYFHNWRKISKMSVKNKERFTRIQLMEKKSLFNMTVKSFYGLFCNFSFIKEVNRIEHKLCQKVKDTILLCNKQKTFKRLSLNLIKQKEKSIMEIPINKRLSSSQLQVQKLKYRFLFYLGEILGTQRFQGKTLLQNMRKSQNNYMTMCGRTAFSYLKHQVIETKQNISKIIELRKSICLKNNFQRFAKSKQVIANYEVLVRFLRNTKAKSGLKVLGLLSSIKKQFEHNFSIIQQCQNKIEIQNILQDTDSRQPEQYYISKCSIQSDIYKKFQYEKLREVLDEKMMSVKVQRVLKKIKLANQQRHQMENRLQLTLLIRQNGIFSALKQNHQLILQRISRNVSLTSIYYKNLKRQSLRALHSHRFIRLSHQEALQAIEQKIINPKQLSYGFDKIYQTKSKIQASERIFQNLENAKIRIVFQKCFYQHVRVIRKSKEMEKRSELRRLEMLFELLRRNQQYNITKSQVIRRSIIQRLAKEKFFKSFRLQSQFTQNFTNVFYFIKEQKQVQFIGCLKNRQQSIVDFGNKSERIQKYLGLSLFRNKLTENNEDIQALQNKNRQLQHVLCLGKLDLFINSLNRLKSSAQELQKKKTQLFIILLRGKLMKFMTKLSYQQKHKRQNTQTKIKQIQTQINFQPFFTKFFHQSRRIYLSRWVDWKRKLSIFERLQSHQQFTKHECNLVRNLHHCRLQNAWMQIKVNIQKERQTLYRKQQQLCDFVGYNRKVQIARVTAKFLSVKSTNESYTHLVNSIKLKYFSKFMRNSLVGKYQKVKSYCAIKSYARNLKQRSFNGLRMMLMRLRDKENRLKTEQQLIVRVDKVMYQSRKSNKLTETIQRFNSSMKRDSMIR